MNLNKNFATLSHSKKTQFQKTFKLLLLKLKNYFAQKHNKIPAQVSNEILALLESSTCSAIGKNNREQGKETKNFDVQAFFLL